MLIELDDCVSVLFPPSAAERPDMTRPLEKLRLPKRRLRVELEEEVQRGRGGRATPTGDTRGTCNHHHQPIRTLYYVFVKRNPGGEMTKEE